MRTGLALALLSAATFSTSGSFARSLTGAGWSPAAAAAARISAAALLLAGPGIISLRGRWQSLWRNAATISIYGLIAVAGAQLFYFNAIQHLSVGVALLLEYCGTVLVVGWMWVRHGHRPRRLTGAGSAVAIVGLLLVLDLFGGARLDPIGVLWGLAAAFALATYFVMSSQVDNDLPPVAMASAAMMVGAAALLGLGAVGAVPMHASFGAVDLLGRRVSWLVPVLGLSLVAAAIAYVAGIGAARRLGPKLATFVGLTEVIFGVLFAWLLLNELPTALQLGGGALIVIGIALVRIDELRAAGTALEAPSDESAKPRSEAETMRTEPGIERSSLSATTQTSSRWHSEQMSDYQIVIHLREPGEPLRILLPGVGGAAAEHHRQKLKYEIEEARLAEVPILAVQASSGQPAESLAVDPLEVTEVDLIEVPIDDPLGASER